MQAQTKKRVRLPSNILAPFNCVISRVTKTGLLIFCDVAISHN